MYNIEHQLLKGCATSIVVQQFRTKTFFVNFFDTYTPKKTKEMIGVWKIKYK